MVSKNSFERTPTRASAFCPAISRSSLAFKSNGLLLQNAASTESRLRKMTIKISSEDKQASPNINVTPLIDVLLVLLIIFMVASPLRPSRFKALVPQPPDKRAYLDPNPKTLVVTVGSDAQLKLNGEANLGSIEDADKLSARLAQVFQDRRDAHVYKSGIDMQALSAEDRVEKTVFIKAPRSLHYGEIAKVIDVVKFAGASPVGLQIDDLAQ